MAYQVLRRYFGLRLVRCLVAAGVVATATGCTESTWDTSTINDTTPTTVKAYAADEAGVTGSLTDYLSTTSDDLNEWAPPRDEAACAAERIVRRLTAARMLELGFIVQSPTLQLPYTPEERTAVINVLVGCVDFAEGMLAMTSAYQKLPLSQSTCMSEGFDRLGLTRDLAGGLVDGAEVEAFANANRFSKGVATIATDCLEEEDLNPSAPVVKMPGAFSRDDPKG